MYLNNLSIFVRESTVREPVIFRKIQHRFECEG
jgi:hypothetical protein